MRNNKERHKHRITWCDDCEKELVRGQGGYAVATINKKMNSLQAYNLFLAEHNRFGKSLSRFPERGD
jgi:hypothetical protein